MKTFPIGGVHPSDNKEWSKSKMDTSIDTGARGWGALVDVIATTINTAATDKVVAGRKCTAYVLKDLPSGKYSNMYEKDAGEPAGNRYVEAVVR